MTSCTSFVVIIVSAWLHKIAKIANSKIKLYSFNDHKDMKCHTSLGQHNYGDFLLLSSLDC